MDLRDNESPGSDSIPSSTSSFSTHHLDLHSIPALHIPQVQLEDEFDILQEIGEGWFSKLYLAEYRRTGSELVLKATHKDSLSRDDLLREFHFALCLSTLNGAKVIPRTFNLLVEAQNCYIWAQELAPFGDLTSNVSEIGIGELYTKRVGRQIGAALDFIHEHELVHRDVKLDNVLIFKSDFSRVKLGDFGGVQRRGSYAIRFNEWVPCSPPEIMDTLQDTHYSVEFQQDTWQFGVLLFLCLTGCIPWQKADRRSDPVYSSFDLWHRSRVMRTPKTFKILTSKAKSLFRKLFDPNPSKRSTGLVDEITKYSEVKWLSRPPGKPPPEDDVLSISMLSFHSELADKNRLLGTLSRYGIETTVDRDLKKDRIQNWIAKSTIAEEEEDNDDEENE